MSGRELLALLREAATGASVSKKAIQELELDDVPLEAKKLANEAWHQLMHYADDEDIRARDEDYAKDLMKTAAWYEEKLRPLVNEAREQ
jgi:hypothetical protein